MINPAQKLASTKAGEHSARRPPEKKRNLLQKAGDWLVGDADLTSPRDWAKGLGQAANENLIQPAYRTASGTNLRTALSPSSTLNQRIKAVGEDALNVIGMIPAAGPIARGTVAAERAGARALASAKAGASAKMTPTADLSTYIFHGGPKPENLVGGVLSPKYVRGGDEYAELYVDRGRQPSVKSGPNQIEKDSILKQFEDAKKFLSTEKPFTSKPGWQSTRDYINDMKEKTNRAENFIKEHEEIVQRILAGEEHQTGVHRLIPGETYHTLYGTEGGTHILNIPKKLQTGQTPAPAGEVKFWGDVKPSGFIPYEYGQSQSTTDALITQAMLDDADRTSMQTQKLANALARVKGQQITPAFKQYFKEVFEGNFKGTMMPYERNPRFGTDSREIVEWFPKYGAGVTPVPKVTNYDEVMRMIDQAKTKDELMSVLDKMIPNEQLDILFKQGLNSKTVQGTKDRMLERFQPLQANYGRLRQ
jgi:hypothetical protein